MRNLTAITLLTIILLTGCFTVDDARHGAVFCEVHQKWMRCEMQPQVADSPPLPGRDYGEAMARLFPHAGPEADLPRSHWRSVKLVVCDDCIRARDHWKLGHLNTRSEP